MSDQHRIAAITLDERSVVRRSPEIEQERAGAITDLLHQNSFAPVSGLAGPFDLHLAVEENRLLIEVAGTDRSRETIQLSLNAFRRIVKDYFVICETYYDSVRRHNLSQVEAIDAGRRALHNEGSALLIEQLADKVAIDHDTGRRLFTLICVLHLRA
jgi:uncharacterized protein (UPF0262 family)